MLHWKSHMLSAEATSPKRLHAAKALALAYQSMNAWTACDHVICRPSCCIWRAIWWAPSTVREKSRYTATIKLSSSPLQRCWGPSSGNHKLVTKGTNRGRLCPALGFLLNHCSVLRPLHNDPCGLPLLCCPLGLMQGLIRLFPLCKKEEPLTVSR